MSFLQNALDTFASLPSLPQFPLPFSASMKSFTAAALAASSHSNLPNPNYHHNPGNLHYVNPLIGTSGVTPNGNGGMIPSVSPPFGMTRWTPQTRENYISQCPYNDLDGTIHGFQATHQPAIWMGESGQVVLVPGVGEVKPLFEERGRRFEKVEERSEGYVYEVLIAAEAEEEGGWNLTESLWSPVPGGAQEVPEEVSEGANGRVRKREGGVSNVGTRRNGRGDDWDAQRVHGGEGRPRSKPSGEKVEGKIKVAMTASSHVGHLRFDFPPQSSIEQEPHVFIQATRQNWTGQISIDSAKREVYGSNPQRQDYALGPFEASRFSGYFVSRFSEPFTSYGISRGADLSSGKVSGHGEHLGAWVQFAHNTSTVEVRTGVSFISVDQARRNLDIEAPASLTFDDAVEELKSSWREKLDRVTIEGANVTEPAYDQRTIWYTALFHALQYPSDFSEPLEFVVGGLRTWYDGYTDSIVEAADSYYQSWSIWDTFRAEHSLLTLFAPERVNSMMRSLLRIYDSAGRLPMWANVVETNIMIGTHVDAVIVNALERNFTDFNVAKAWEAVKKNAYEPPEKDEELLFYDREPDTPQEVRAGLTGYMKLGYVPNDQWAEAGSRTLDYAFDDYAAAIVAAHAGDHSTAAALKGRSQNYRTIYNPTTTFMNSRNANGSFAAPEQGWTEGDAWIYTFSVPHDPLGLASLLGGREAMKAKLDEYFSGGHNDHSNEPSHHAPYLYSALGYPYATANLTREIARQEYNATAAGLSGNEDLGQMSAWYIFSALGFYPLNPAGDEYVVGAPFFENVTLRLPAGVASGGAGGEERVVVISAPGAREKAFVKGLKVDGGEVERPVLRHRDVVGARVIEFEMSDMPTDWGREGI